VSFKKQHHIWKIPWRTGSPRMNWQHWENLLLLTLLEATNYWMDVD
jgi:hypothetical protein